MNFLSAAVLPINDVSFNGQQQAAQVILQRSTIVPGITVIGQVVLKATAKPNDTVRLDVPLDTAQFAFAFSRTKTSR